MPWCERIQTGKCFQPGVIPSHNLTITIINRGTAALLCQWGNTSIITNPFLIVKWSSSIFPLLLCFGSLLTEKWNCSEKIGTFTSGGCCNDFQSCNASFSYQCVIQASSQAELINDLIFASPLGFSFEFWMKWPDSERIYNSSPASHNFTFSLLRIESVFSLELVKQANSTEMYLQLLIFSALQQFPRNFPLLRARFAS